MERTTALLIDDHTLVRRGCRQALEAAGFEVVAEAGDGEEGVRAFETHRPALVIMDLSMEAGSGLEAIRRIVAIAPRARVLVLSMHDEPAIAARAITAGAAGYVTKTTGAQDFMRAVHEVASGGRYISDDAALALALAAAMGDADPLAALTDREFEIFRLLVDGRKTGEISETLGISPKSVTNNYLRIKQKLNAGNLADLVRLAISTGAEKRNILPPTHDVSD